MTKLSISQSAPTATRVHDLSRAASKLAGGFVDQTVVSGASFLAAVTVGRAGGAAELGIYSLGLSVVALAISAQDAAISSPYIVFGPRLSEPERRVFAGSTLLQSCALAGLTAAPLALAAAIGQMLDRPHPAWAACGWLALLIPGALGRQFGRKASFAHHRPWQALWMDGVTAAIQLSFIAWLALEDRVTAGSAYLATACACLLSTCWWWRLSRHEYTFDLSHWRRDWQRSTSLGKWVLASRLVSVSHGYLVPWVLGILAGTQAVGLFAACLNVVSISHIALYGLSNVLEPRMAQAFASGGASEVRRVERRVTTLLGGVMSVILLLLVGWGHLAVQWIFGATEFTDHRPTVMVLAMAAFLEAIGMGAGQGLRIMDRAQANVRANLVGLAVTLLLACIAAPVWGVLGGAAALLCGNLVATIVRHVSFALAVRGVP